MGHAVVGMIYGAVSLFYTLSWLWGFLIMFPSVSIRICAAQQCPADHFTQVDPTGHDAWVAGTTTSSLDGHSKAGRDDIFLMKFQVTGLKVERWVVGALSLEPSGQLLHASSGVVRTSSNRKRYHFCLGLRMFGRS